MKMRVAPLLAQFAENIYPATVEKLELSTGVYGEFFQWSFSVKKKGVPVTVTGLTSTVFNPKSKFYRWSSAVTGKEFQDGEELDTDMLHGAPCRVYLVVIAVHLSVFEPGGQVLGNPSPPLSLSFVMEPTSSGCPEKP
jgi:hypothetical protein